MLGNAPWCLRANLWWCHTSKPEILQWSFHTYLHGLSVTRPSRQIPYPALQLCLSPSPPALSRPQHLSPGLPQWPSYCVSLLDQQFSARGSDSLIPWLPTWGHLTRPGDVFGCHSWGRGVCVCVCVRMCVWVASSRQRTGILLNTLQSIKQHLPTPDKESPAPGCP